MRVGPRSPAAGLAVLALVAFGVTFGVTRALDAGGHDTARAEPATAASSPESVTLEDQRIPRLDPLGALPPLRRRPPPPPDATPSAPQQSPPGTSVTPTPPSVSPVQPTPAPDTGVEDFE